jgi:hypothetical protein
MLYSRGELKFLDKCLVLVKHGQQTRTNCMGYMSVSAHLECNWCSKHLNVYRSEVCFEQKMKRIMKYTTSKPRALQISLLKQNGFLFCQSIITEPLSWFWSNVAILTQWAKRQNSFHKCTFQNLLFTYLTIAFFNILTKFVQANNTVNNITQGYFDIPRGDNSCGSSKCQEGECGSKYRYFWNKIIMCRPSLLL